MTLRFAFIAALLVALTAAGCSGGADRPSEEEFRQAYQDMGRVVQALEAGDLNGAYVEFQRPHDFTHRIDPPLRERDPDLAQRLYDAVLVMESYDSTDQEILAAARDVRQYLLEAARAFGYEIAEARATGGSVRDAPDAGRASATVQ